MLFCNIITFLQKPLKSSVYIWTPSVLLSVCLWAVISARPEHGRRCAQQRRSSRFHEHNNTSPPGNSSLHHSNHLKHLRDGRMTRAVSAPFLLQCNTINRQVARQHSQLLRFCWSSRKLWNSNVGIYLLVSSFFSVLNNFNFGAAVKSSAIQKSDGLIPDLQSLRRSVFAQDIESLDAFTSMWLLMIENWFSLNI